MASFKIGLKGIFLIKYLILINATMIIVTIIGILAKKCLFQARSSFQLPLVEKIFFNVSFLIPPLFGLFIFPHSYYFFCLSFKTLVVVCRCCQKRNREHFALCELKNINLKIHKKIDRQKSDRGLQPFFRLFKDYGQTQQVKSDIMFTHINNILHLQASGYSGNWGGCSCGGVLLGLPHYSLQSSERPFVLRYEL